MIYVCHCAPVPICDNFTQWLPWLVYTFSLALAPIHDWLVSLVVIIPLHREGALLSDVALHILVRLMATLMI